MISRKLLRWLVRLAVLLSILSLTVFIMDLWYDFLPSSIQTRLPLHPPDPVVIDIMIKRCNLFSSCDITGGGWHKQPKDLYLGQSWTSKAFVYTRTMNENELPSGQEVVKNIAIGKFDLNDLDARIPVEIYEDILPLAESPDHLLDRHIAYKLATNQGWSIKDKELGIWVKKGKHSPNAAVTAVKVLFGLDARYPLPHWSLCEEPMSIGVPGYEPRLAARIGRQEERVSPTLKFNKDGKLKIVQLADLHMSTGFGKCSYPVPYFPNESLCHADILTTELVEDVLSTEKPDYAVFTGDQIFGNKSPDPETALLKAIAPVIEHKIPFSVVWGNHDEQGPLNNTALMDIVLNLPYAIAYHGPKELPGDGNYIVTASPPSSDYPALSMVFLDSHSKLPAKSSGYDFIRPEQHEFVRHEMDKIRAKLHGYPHIPLSMAFFHIPIPEYRDGVDRTAEDALIRVGDQRETIIGPTYNSGTLKALQEQGVSVISVGHDHVNDFCQLQPKSLDSTLENVWLCYGGAAGYGGYGGYPDNMGNYKRRVRVFEVDMNLPYIETWHRVQNVRARQNFIRLVDNGVARYGNGEIPLSEEDE